LAERARTTGQIELVVRRGDVEVLRIAVKNTIVYGGRTALLLLLQQALGGPAAMGGTPGHLVPGTNGTPPTVGDLALGAPLGGSDQIALTAPNLSVNGPSGEIVVTGTLSTTQGNGSTLREVGLVLANGDLFARQVHPAVSKTALLTVTYTWRVAVTS
jgi:hypothetical protein